MLVTTHVETLFSIHITINAKIYYNSLPELQIFATNLENVFKG